MAEAKPAENKYEEVFDEDGDVPKEAPTIHRIRANSTIMQLSKILGESKPLVELCHSSRSSRRGQLSRAMRV
jgi:hypothetical protein